tara:strand:- start:255 stop:554 length:300 start_codon:yes stop_codon:yes gene_type:complete
MPKHEQGLVMYYNTDENALTDKSRYWCNKLLEVDKDCLKELKISKEFFNFSKINYFEDLNDKVRIVFFNVKTRVCFGITLKKKYINYEQLQFNAVKIRK